MQTRETSWRWDMTLPDIPEELLDQFVTGPMTAEAVEAVTRRFKNAVIERAQAGLEPSVGSRGDSYDNALAETINGLYKAKVIHRFSPWKTRASIELATLEWVSWFNHHRLLAPIGYIPPAEAEENYYQKLAQRPQ